MDLHTGIVTTAQDRRTYLTAVVIVFLSLVWISISARTWVRSMVSRNYGWDDAVMLLAAVSVCVCTSHQVEIVC